jgi:hypothetical protein
VRIDHVLIAVPDLDAGKLEERYGLDSVPGGRHTGWGTANRIVPLGDAYLELVAVVDPAADSAFARWVAQGEGLLGWAVRTDDLDAVAGRLGLTTHAGSRAAPDGAPVEWRTAGLEQAIAEPCLPFFIQWDERTSHPGSAGGPFRLDSIGLRGDPNRIEAWLGPKHGLPLTVVPGEPRIAHVSLAGAGDREDRRVIGSDACR